MRIQAKQKNHGQMLTISPIKLAISKGHCPPGMNEKKINKIKEQVRLRLAHQQAIKTYQPFTSKASRRKPKQVGA
jgi:hypothetical protein